MIKRKDDFAHPAELRGKRKETKDFLRNACILLVLCLGLSIFLHKAGFTFHQILSSTILLATVLGTLLFWQFRLGIAFIGIAILLFSHTLDVKHMVEFASFDVILVMVGMMTLVGMLRDVGFFHWLRVKLIRLSNHSAKRFVVFIGVISAFLACIVSEVTSIIFTTRLIFTVCRHYKVSSIPFIILGVMATNIGSSGTMLGNPVGLLIGLRAHLTIEDFLMWSFPVTVLALAITLSIILLWFRKPIAELDEKMKAGSGERFDEWEGVESKRNFCIGAVIFAVTVLFIGLHHRLESRFNFGVNSLLIAAPLLGAGLAMLWRRERARYYIDNDVDWWALTFFIMLFSLAGTLKFTGVTGIVANSAAAHLGGRLAVLIPAVLVVSMFGSSILDNVVLVAAFIPVVEHFASLGINNFSLWWALLFGACYGGNITMVGSTANIVALGMLEKEERHSISFRRWITIGLITSIASAGVAYLVLLATNKFMP